jgi:hypothetical protein
MAIFQDVTLAWKDEKFTIPGSKELGAIAIVEEHITFTEMIDALGRGRPPLVAIAKAFAGVLRYAGANVTDEQAYEGMFSGGSLQRKIIDSINTLLVMMVPPSSLAAKTEGVIPSGNPQAAASKRSKRSTKRRSGKAG